MEPYLEYGGITEVIQSKSKNSRFEAQDKGPYNPFVLCRMFATRKGGKLRLFILLRHLLWRKVNSRFSFYASKNKKERNMKKGFTLIELLVVVLIIGILTAVALPKYEKAQRKALFTEVQMVSKNLMTALEAHGMSNGYYFYHTVISGTDSSVALDIEIPWTKCDEARCYTQAGSWYIWGQLNKFYIDFIPNSSKLVHNQPATAYRFQKGMETPWTLADNGSNGGLVYTSTYQLFCDWWVDGGGATTADFASKCK